MTLTHLRYLNMLKERRVLSYILNSKCKIKMSKSYEDAVNCMNSLQSNLNYIKNVASKGVLPHSKTFSTTIAEVEKYLLRTGVTLDQLDKLSVIHVAGTKGKGSTCAFSESILRQYGYKTGFYSSPHLVEIRERIRLNGKPLSKEIFAENFFRVYDQLTDTRDHPQDMPAYFRFLTVLAFNIFLSEKVDVVILEVGIGGEYDCTNVVRNTPIVGITSLGIEHTQLLGDTIELIANQKAGIMKKNCKAFTIHQRDAAMNVLKEKSVERECTLQLVPDFNEYIWDSPPKLGMFGDIQKINASLAIQLSHNWLKYCGNVQSIPDNLTIPEKTKIGLEVCKWPGRNQILKTSLHTFYLDGAHTTDSLEICAEWFKKSSPNNACKALIFNATGDRNSEDLLKQLISLNFNHVMFVPNRASAAAHSADQINLVTTDELQIKRCEIHNNIWLNLNQTLPVANQTVSIFYGVDEAIKSLPVNEKCDILITGSLHLVGAALKLLDPDLNSF